MLTNKFHFMRKPDETAYVLVNHEGPIGHAGRIDVIGQWPCGYYSREKAQSRADRCVGEFIRRENANNRDGVIVIYTHDNIIKQVKADPEVKESQLKPGSWRTPQSVIDADVED